MDTLEILKNLIQQRDWDYWPDSAIMLLPEPEKPWKWNMRAAGQPSEYLGSRTTGSGIILHREQRKHFFISP